MELPNSAPLVPVVTSRVALNVARILKALKHCWAKLWTRMRKSPKYFQQWSRNELKRRLHMGPNCKNSMEQESSINAFLVGPSSPRQEKRAPEFKAAKHRWTVMLMPTPSWDRWVTSAHTCCYNSLLFLVIFLLLRIIHSLQFFLAHVHSKLSVFSR